MVGCCVTLLFSLVDPHLWIFSSRHRQFYSILLYSTLLYSTLLYSTLFLF